jgi:hypothetical protein
MKKLLIILATSVATMTAAHADRLSDRIQEMQLEQKAQSTPSCDLALQYQHAADDVEEMIAKLSVAGAPISASNRKLYADYTRMFEEQRSACRRTIGLDK